MGLLGLNVAIRVQAIAVHCCLFEMLYRPVTAPISGQNYPVNCTALGVCMMLTRLGPGFPDILTRLDGGTDLSSYRKQHDTRRIISSGQNRRIYSMQKTHAVLKGGTERSKNKTVPDWTTCEEQLAQITFCRVSSGLEKRQMNNRCGNRTGEKCL